MFTAFVNDDESDSVRQAVAVALPVLAERITDSSAKRRFTVAGIEALFESGVNCRCAGLEILGQLIYLFADDPEGPPQELLDRYWDDSDSRQVNPGDCVWDIIATYNVSQSVIWKMSALSDNICSSQVYALRLGQNVGPSCVVSSSDYRIAAGQRCSASSHRFCTS